MGAPLPGEGCSRASPPSGRVVKGQELKAGSEPACLAGRTGTLRNDSNSRSPRLMEEMLK